MSDNSSASTAKAPAKKDSVKYWKSMYENKVKDCQRVIEGMKKLQQMCKILQQENETLEEKLTKYQSTNNKNTETATKSIENQTNVSDISNESEPSKVTQEQTPQQAEKMEHKSENEETVLNKENNKKNELNDKTIKNISDLSYIAIVGANENACYLATLIKQSGNYNVMVIDSNGQALRQASETIKMKEKQLNKDLKTINNVNKICYTTKLEQIGKFPVKFVIETISQRVDLKKRLISDIFSFILTKSKQDSSLASGENKENKENKANKEKKNDSVVTSNNAESKEIEHSNKEVITTKNKNKNKIELNSIIISVSSMWSVTELAGVLPHEYQSSVIGINFTNNMNDNSKYIEIRPAWQTTPQIIDETKQFVKSLKILNRSDSDSNNNMSFITVRDSPGLVKFRLLAVYINEAFSLLQQKICSAKEIDAIMSESMQNVNENVAKNKIVGPLALADCIGLDQVMGILNVLHTELGDSKYCPNFMLKQYVRSGRLGRKTKIGVYVYH